MSEKLNFGNAGDDSLRAFDNAPGPDSFDLSGFDAATGATTVPPGKYVCRIEAGELTATKAGKTAYRLRFATVEPAALAGFTLWRYFVLADSGKILCGAEKFTLQRFWYDRGGDYPTGKTNG
jgi:hypothetical protein